MELVVTVRCLTCQCRSLAGNQRHSTGWTLGADDDWQTLAILQLGGWTTQQQWRDGELWGDVQYWSLA